MSQTKVAEVHQVSAERGAKHAALAAELNDVGGALDPSVTVMSAMVDMLHHLAATTGAEADGVLDLVKHHYEADLTGEW